MSLWTVTGLSSMFSNISEFCHVVLTVCQHNQLLSSAGGLTTQEPYISGVHCYHYIETQNEL